MDNISKDKFLSRIICGYRPIQIGNLALRLVPPSPEDRYQADLLYEEIVLDGCYSGLMSEEDALELLVYNGIWRQDLQDKLDTVTKDIDTLKVKLYQFAHKSREVELGRKLLNVAKEEQIKLMGIRHSFDHFTFEGFANIVRFRQLTMASLRGPHNERVEVEDSEVIESIISDVTAHTISETCYRELARNEPWRSMWNAGKGREIFSGSAAHMSEEQRYLISFSLLYDSIYESQDCPDDKVIEDDDMLDGWLIVQRKNREKNKVEKSIEERITNQKIRNSGEVFLAAGAKDTVWEDITVADVNNINDPTAHMIKRQREQFIKDKGRTNEVDLPDVRRRLMMEANQQIAQRMKGG